MKEISYNNGKYKLPNCWELLTPMQFAKIAKAIYLYISKEKDVVEFRLMVLEAISGYKRSCAKISKEYQEQINCNLLIMSCHIDFVLTPEYVKDEVWNVISLELKKALQDNFPNEIYDAKLIQELIRVQNMLSWQPVINTKLPKNLIPELHVNNEIWHGPVFSLPGGILQTDLMAGEYLDARELVHTFSLSGDINHLKQLAAVLYRTDRKIYKTSETQLRMIKLASGFETLLYGIWFQFICWQEYFIKHPVFSILFQSEYDGKNKINLGSSETIYSMSKDGYGTVEEVANMNVVDYLLIQIKYLKDGVGQLRALEKNDAEIARTMELPVETIMML